MTAERPTAPLRVTVAGPDPLVVELEPTTIAGLVETPGAVRARPIVTVLPARRDAAASDRYEVVVDGWRFEVEVEPAGRAALRERASRAATLGHGGGRQVLRAQIPGRIVDVAVRVGEAIEAGQRLLSVEAMKMENFVSAPRAGTIARVGVVAGQTVELGDELVEIE